MIQTALSDFWQAILSSAPTLIQGLTFIVLGWLLGRILGWITTRFLQRLKLDEAGSRIGLSTNLQRIGLNQTPSRFMGGVIFWAVFLSFLLLAFEAIGLQSLFEPVQALLAYLPRILAAALIIIAGTWIAQFVSRTLQAALVSMGLESPQAIAGVMRAVVLFLAVILAIDQLGINTSLLNDMVTIVIAIAIGGVALAFAFGSREITRDILSSYYLRERFQPGDRIKLLDRDGTLEAIGSLHSEISTKEGLWIIPNKDLIDGQVVILDRPVSEE